MIIFRQETKENRCPIPKKLNSTPALKKFDESCNSGGAHPLPVAPLRAQKISLVSMAEAPDLVFMLLNGKSHLHFHCVYDLVK